MISLLCCLTLAGSPLPVAAAPLVPSAQDLDPQDDIRGAIRWLRSVQDPVDGSYGASVEATALVLTAMARCPDRYRVADGPFVRRAFEFLLARQAEDGSIAAQGAPADERARSTRAAVEALMALGEESARPALARALAFVGQEASDVERAPAPPTREEALAQARRILSARDDRGRWSGERGEVVESAEAVIELSRLRRALLPSTAGAAGETHELPEFAAIDRAKALAAMARGADFLAALGPDGRFGAPGQPDAGLTAMAIAGLCALPQPRPEAVQKSIDAGLAWLVTLQREDGSIHDGKLANYITSASILALSRGGEGAYDGAVAKARAFLQRLQNDEGEGYSEGDLYYGGIGYGSTERPDLSNLQMALEALSESGLEEGDETYTKALRFLQRCQNRSESSDLRIVDGGVVIESGNDGGAGYLPGDSKAGFVELADGRKVPRSYGSMTYALLKCFVLAGLEKDDPRLKAAFDWCQQNYTLDVNPGFEASADPRAAYQGLFYYFLTMAQALDALGAERIVDGSGREHAWRAELSGRLVAMQSKIDGSWLNRNSPRWYEGNPLLATAYALLTLRAALPADAGDGR